MWYMYWVLVTSSSSTTPAPPIGFSRCSSFLKSWTSSVRVIDYYLWTSFIYRNGTYWHWLAVRSLTRNILTVDLENKTWIRYTSISLPVIILWTFNISIREASQRKSSEREIHSVKPSTECTSQIQIHNEIQHRHPFLTCHRCERTCYEL